MAPTIGRRFRNDGRSVSKVALMPDQVTICRVPERVRDALAQHAAAKGMSLQEFLSGELERIASPPLIEEWLRTVRAHKEAAGSRVTAAAILRARDADRS